jgi:hypothetical protein
LLYLKNIKIPQDKWYRNFTEASIDIESQIYTLAATENKRHLIIDSTGKLIATKPYHLVDGKKDKYFNEILYYLPTLLEHLLLPLPFIVSINLRLPLPFIVSINLRLPSPKVLLSLPSNNIIYLPPPIPEVILVYPALPSVIYIPPMLSDFDIEAKLKVSPPSPTCLPGEENKIKRSKLGFTIQVVDLKTNKTTIYFSYREAERELNMGSGTITRRIKQNITKPYKKRYLISKIL